MREIKKEYRRQAANRMIGTTTTARRMMTDSTGTGTGTTKP